MPVTVRRDAVLAACCATGSWLIAAGYSQHHALLPSSGEIPAQIQLASASMSPARHVQVSLALLRRKTL